MREGGVYAEAEVEPEYDLHFRASAGESAADFPLCDDDGGGTDGLWEDDGGELVFGGARPHGRADYHPDQRLFR